MWGLMKKEKKAKWYRVKRDKKLRSSSPVSSDSETATPYSDSSNANATSKFIAAGGSSSSVETPRPPAKDTSRRSLPPSLSKTCESKRSRSTPPQSLSFSADFECTEVVLTHDSGSTVILPDTSGGAIEPTYGNLL